MITLLKKFRLNTQRKYKHTWRPIVHLHLSKAIKDISINKHPTKLLTVLIFPNQILALPTLADL